MNSKPHLQNRRDTINGIRIFTWFSDRPDLDKGYPPVILVHGLSVSSRYMLPVASALRVDFCVYAPDLPGYGRSDKPERAFNIPELAIWLRNWMDALGLNQCVFLGNSMGCQIILEFARSQPGRVAAAVLAGPVIDPHARSAVRQIIRGLRNMLFEPPSLIPILIHDYLSAGLPRTFKTLQDAIDEPVRDRLMRMPVPTWIVRGEHDTIVPQRWAEEAASLLKNGKLRVIRGGAHAVNYDSAEPLADVVRNALNP